MNTLRAWFGLSTKVGSLDVRKVYNRSKIIISHVDKPNSILSTYVLL